MVNCNWYASYAVLELAGFSLAKSRYFTDDESAENLQWPMKITSIIGIKFTELPLALCGHAVFEELKASCLEGALASWTGLVHKAVQVRKHTGAVQRARILPARSGDHFAPSLQQQSGRSTAFRSESLESGELRETPSSTLQRPSPCALKDSLCQCEI